MQDLVYSSGNDIFLCQYCCTSSSSERCSFRYYGSGVTLGGAQIGPTLGNGLTVFTLIPNLIACYPGYVCFCTARQITEYVQVVLIRLFGSLKVRYIWDRLLYGWMEIEN